MPIKQKDPAPRGLSRASGLRDARDSQCREPAPLREAFADPRSGRDRRDGSGNAEISRRSNGERRRSRPGNAWWLGRNYVEFHDVSVSPTPQKYPEQE
jgi:hypothetical protein